ncbi:glycoside hydrolase [Pseudomassariella vexata]|uniref:Mannosyl-oligosaccharide glucosidase n=1 Tax=Pseudomassariella vexata TaxID=1141098 RepID=A0A1Y2EG12_9PEZI|nr:glycoside hydrolase [Pseudomassariella vexata]ORY70511.1 glycoside hydrolase [Pseudomassariella vexata]
MRHTTRLRSATKIRGAAAKEARLHLDHTSKMYIHPPLSGVAIFACLWTLAQPSNFTTSEASFLKWGPYRPNLYFGVRPQVPRTLLMGLMWANAKDQNTITHTLRDTCEQDDGMGGYGWTQYDARSGGRQILHDEGNGIDITTDFVKSLQDGDSWAVRVAGVPKAVASSTLHTAIIFHLALEGTEDERAKTLTCQHGDQVLGTGHRVVAVCNGSDPALGAFRLQALDYNQNKIVKGLAVNSVRVAEDHIWQAKSVFLGKVKATKGDGTQFQDNPGEENMHFLQAIFEGAFTIEFSYSLSATQPLKPDYLDTRIKEDPLAFAGRVDVVFPRTAPWDSHQYAEFTESLLSNLLGGLGFFYGDSKLDASYAQEYEETSLDFWDRVAGAMSRATIATTKPSSLLSFTPSRPFFPRGFLWDEGFHLLPIIEWDLDLAIAAVQSWLSLMDDDGWIGREQILGPEARSKVPDQFQVQYPHYANPPTISLLFPIILSKITGSSPYTGKPSRYQSSPDEASKLLTGLYPLLHRHYAWFRRTQAGNFSAYTRPEGVITGEGYRWRGRTPTHTLTSGLDDYPRANPPHPGELHIDALAWVAASAKALQEMALHLGEEGDAIMYGKQVDETLHNLDVLHWDPAEKAYCDATIDQNGKYERVCRLGYISLMPLLLGLVDGNHSHLPSMLDLLSNPDKLWSPFGIRSLSASDANYGKDEDYWRGAVWINLNVLATLQLSKLGTQAGPEQARALTPCIQSTKSRDRDCAQHDHSGQGRRSRAFTGWTSCLLLLMSLETGSTENSEYLRSSRTALLVVVAVIILGLVIYFRRRAMSFLNHVPGIVLKKRLDSRKPAYQEIINLDELE